MRIIELNIGLSSKTHGAINYIKVLNSLTGRGFETLKYRIVESVSNDGKELCMAWKGKAPADWQEQLASLSDKYGQDCIAVCGFIGHDPYDCFLPECWKTPHRYKVQFFADGAWHDSRRPFGSLPLYDSAEQALAWIKASGERSNSAARYEYRVVTEETPE